MRSAKQSSRTSNFNVFCLTCPGIKQPTSRMPGKRRSTTTLPAAVHFAIKINCVDPAAHQNYKIALSSSIYILTFTYLQLTFYCTKNGILIGRKNYGNGQIFVSFHTIWNDNIILFQFSLNQLLLDTSCRYLHHENCAKSCRQLYYCASSSAL